MTATYAVPTDPTDLVAGLGLTVGTSYILEVVAGNPPVRMFEGGALAPTDRSYFHTVRAGVAGRLGVTPATGVKVWVWAGKPSRLAVTEQS